MDIKNAGPDVLARYIDFLIGFTTGPGGAVSRQVETTEDVAPGVSPRLILFAGLSATLAYVIVEVGAAIGMAEDPSHIVRFASRLDRLIAPLVCVFLIVAAGVVIHVAFRVVGYASTFMGHENFRGPVSGSINAALGFSAWAIPLLTLVIVGIRIAAQREYTPGPVAIFLIAVPPALAFWIYFIAAIAGVHKIPRGQVASLFSMVVVLSALAADLFD